MAQEASFDPSSYFRARKLNPKNITVWVKKHDQKLIEHQAQELFIPASLSKIVTGLAILEELPSSFQLKTQLLAKGKIKDGVLVGDLVLKGGGDPSFVSENMWFLVNELRRSGVQKVKGDILVDDSFFDDESFSETRQDERVDRAYDAPVGAMSFNWNSVNIYVRPGAKNGEPAQVYIDPLNEYIQLENKAKTSASKGGIGVSRVSTPNGDRITVSGSIAVGSKEVVIYKSITKPALWAGYNLKQFMLEKRITVEGEVKRGKATQLTDVLAESKSKPLPQIVADMMKFSNNYVAEMLVKNLAAEKKGGQGTLPKGMEVLREFLLKSGLKKDSFQFLNPSGLTRDNKLTASQLGELLSGAQLNFRIQPEFFSSLPIGGIDGTLKNRFKDISETVRAKTGLLTGVVGLAGYGRSPNGEPFTFVLMYNGPDDFLKVKTAFDDFVEEFVKGNR